MDKLIDWLDYEAMIASHKNNHLTFEISIAQNDDNEFEHEGYYDSVDEAIEALMKYKDNKGEEK